MCEYKTNFTQVRKMHYLYHAVSTQIYIFVLLSTHLTILVEVDIRLPICGRDNVPTPGVNQISSDIYKEKGSLFVTTYAKTVALMTEISTCRRDQEIKYILRKTIKETQFSIKEFAGFFPSFIQ